jgi:hypothetical protein
VERDSAFVNHSNLVTPSPPINIHLLYEIIQSLKKKFQWEDVALNPDTFIEARFPKEFIEALKEGQSKVFLHRERAGAKVQSELAEVFKQAKQHFSSNMSDEVVMCQVSQVKYGEVEFGRDDFPVKIYAVKHDTGTEYHLFGLDSETWVKQTLFMLVYIGVPPNQIEDADPKFDLVEHVKQEITELLKIPEGSQCTSIESLTIGTKGLIPQAIERIALESNSYRTGMADYILKRLSEYLHEEEEKLGKFDPVAVLQELKNFAVANANAANSLKKLILQHLKQDADSLLKQENETSLEHQKMAALSKEALDDPALKAYARSIAGCKRVKQLKDIVSGREAVEGPWAECLIELDLITDVTAQNLAGLADQEKTKILMKSIMKAAIIDARANVESDTVRQKIQAFMNITNRNIPPEEKVKQIKEDPQLSSDETIRKILESDHDITKKKLLPVVREVNGKGKIPGMLMKIQGKCHLLLSINDTHGDLSYHVVKEALIQNPKLRINFFGTCGSLKEDVPITTFVIPQDICNFEPTEGILNPVKCLNRAFITQGVLVKHANVCTLLQEDQKGIGQMLDSGCLTVDMESYHVTRAIVELGGSAELRIIMRVSDVAVSKEHGAQSKLRLEAPRTDQFDRDMEEVVQDFGLINKKL